MQFAAGLAKSKGLDVKVVELTDWVAINEVVHSGDVDVNLFQHGNPAQTYRSLDDVTLAPVNITYLLAAGGDLKAALIIDRTIDDGLVLRFTARPEKKDDPRLKDFIEVFKLRQVKQFIEEKLPAFIPAGFNG
ncbi:MULTISPECIES: MetQ/NlpA family ABC transporter substrate-binding protein [unclassified Bradyrhizobium]